MRNIESELKKINDLEIRMPNSEFKANLRKRLLNEYDSILLESSSGIKEKKTQTFFKHKNIIRNMITFFKYQSALNLSVIFLSIFSFSAIASYFAIPNEIKQSLIGNKAAVDIVSSIDGAKVYINGDLIGETPLENYKLPVGNYTIRVEKDGYVVYSESVNVDKEKENIVLAELQEDLGTTEAYANWLDYKNSELDFSFKYPSDWKISEEVGNENNQDFKVRLTKDSDQIVFVVNPSNNDLDLDKSSDVLSYKRNIKLGKEDQESSRYMQFNSEGTYIGGGLSISGSDKYPPVLVVYKLSGYEETILNSEVLSVMDQMTQSLIVNGSGYVVAFDSEENQNERIDLSEISDIATDPTDMPKPTTPSATTSSSPIAKIDLSQSYSNSIYGYTIAYPDDWEVAITRATYPVGERGFMVNSNKGELEVSRLRLKSNNIDGKIYILATNEDVDILNIDSNSCSNHSASQVKSFFGKYKLISTDGSYDFQVCNGNSSNFVFNSGINGNITYNIYLSIDDEDMTSEALEQFKAIISSLKFNESVIKTKIDDIKRDYNNFQLGVSMQYPYKWELGSASIDCVDEADVRSNCIGYGFNSTSGIRKIVFSEKYKPTGAEGMIAKPKSIATKSGNLNFIEYFEKECHEDTDECKSGKFLYGVYSNDSISITYYSIPENDRELIDAIGSISIK